MPNLQFMHIINIAKFFMFDFITIMKIQTRIRPKGNRQSFNGFLETSAGVQNNAVLNRALINAGFNVQWMINANNKWEVWEKFRQSVTFLGLAYIAPLFNVPAANRIFMWLCGLTDGWSDNNHKAIQLSNKYLVSPEKTLEGLKEYNILTDINGKPKISERFFCAPIEKIVKKLSCKKLNDQIDIERLLKKCDGNLSLLQKRISRAKNLTLCSDLIITCATLGFIHLLNNYLTKRATGKSGFSAELEMADAKTIAKRAENYEKNKKKNIKIILTEIALISTLIPFAVHKGLTSKTKNIFSNFIKKYGTLTDYTKGIFMSKFIIILSMISATSSVILFSRNNTERKDMAVRIPLTNSVMLGGDLLITSAMTNLLDKIFKTKLCKENQRGIFYKVFPKFKSLEQISKEVSSNQISQNHRNIAASVYWAGMALCSAAIGFILPKVCNAMIKSDVNSYVKKNNNISKNQIQQVFKQFNAFTKCA